ncbi:MAG: hypothetical protein JRI59_02050 [Deltaproteobacteria bacterium]|nr:hypothetical protein [Deltaproteobacteria bacterium]
MVNPPIGFGVCKMQIFNGRLSLKMGVEFKWMPLGPDARGQKFNRGVVIAPILPSPFGGTK